MHESFCLGAFVSINYYFRDLTSHRLRNTALKDKFTETLLLQWYFITFCQICITLCTTYVLMGSLKQRQVGLIFLPYYKSEGGSRYRSWLRHYATSWKVAGSIPNELIWPNPSSRTTALGSIQPLTEMSTTNLPGGKGRPAREADLTTICEPIV
jgi:hypothetical protein